MVVLIVLVLNLCAVACSSLSTFSYFGYVWVIEWPPIGKIAAHSAYDMLSLYLYLIVNLAFPTSVFGVGIFL